MLQGYVLRICYRDKTQGFVEQTLRDMLRGQVFKEISQGYVAEYVPGVRCRDMPKFLVAREQVSMCAVTFNWFNIYLIAITLSQKNEKGKSQIGINQANKPNKFIFSIRKWTSYLPVGICYCFKAEKQSKKLQRRNAAAANESTLRKCLNQPN